MEPRSFDVPSFISSLNLASFEILRTAQRQICAHCGSRKMIYCDKCQRLLVSRDEVPLVALPLQVHIFKHVAERSSKSSVIPLAFLCPSSVTITTCMPNDKAIPAYSPTDTMLIFPSPGARLLQDLSEAEFTAVRRVVVIDSTWGQTTSMVSSAHLQSLPALRLQDYTTIFWRQQSESKDFLSTIEALYYFLREYITEQYRRGLRTEAYSGELDNLLWHFVYTYELIQGEYKSGRKKGRTFKKDPEYIQDPAKERE